MHENRALTNADFPWLDALTKRLAALWQDEAVRVSFAVFVVLRVVTGFAALVMVNGSAMQRPALLWFDPETHEGNPSGEVYYQALPPHAPLESVVAPWRVYDTVWYIKVAIQGYRADNGIVFPPLYPMLIGAVAPLVGHNYVLASLVISNVCCFLLFILLYKLVLREFGDTGLAKRTLICLAAFPTAYYLVAGYTEPLYIVLTLGALLSAFDKRWMLAGALAFLASLTRLQGLVLCLPLAWIAFVQYRADGRRAIIERLPAVIGAAFGTACYYGYLVVNDLGSLERAYNYGWRLTTAMPWVSIQAYIQRLTTGQAQGFENTNAIITLLMILLAVIVTLKMRPVFAIYTWSTLFVLLLRYHYGTELQGAQFESMIRYVLALFPCFIALGMLLKSWRLVPYCAFMLEWQFFLLNSFLHWRWVA